MKDALSTFVHLTGWKIGVAPTTLLWRGWACSGALDNKNDICGEYIGHKVISYPAIWCRRGGRGLYVCWQNGLESKVLNNATSSTLCWLKWYILVAIWFPWHSGSAFGVLPTHPISFNYLAGEVLRLCKNHHRVPGANSQQYRYLDTRYWYECKPVP